MRNATNDERLICGRFPRASRYHPEWLLAGVSGAANPLWRFVQPGGPIGIAGAGFLREIDGVVPAHLREWRTTDQPWCLHSAEWWRRHWARTGILAIEVADTLDEGWRRWLDWLRLVAPGNATEIGALEADAGAHLGYVRVVGRGAVAGAGRLGALAIREKTAASCRRRIRGGHGQIRMMALSSAVVTLRSRKPNSPLSFTSRTASRNPVMAAR